MQRLIHIKNFKDFSISFDGKSLTYQTLTKQLSILLSFLVMRKNFTPTHIEIANALWPSGVKNSRAALKNLVYRFKKTCEKEGFEELTDMIISKNGSYVLNSKYKYVVDSLIFEDYYKKYQTSTEISQKLVYLDEITKLYHGTYLSILPPRDWIKKLQEKYNDFYLKSLYSLLELQRQTNDFDALYATAVNATIVDNYNEKVHQYIMFALNKKGLQKKAIEHYNYITKLFYKDLSKNLSTQTQKMFSEIAKTSIKTQRTSFEISTYLREEPQIEEGNAFYCELEIFKYIYQLYERKTIRDFTENYMVMFTLDDSTSTSKELREKSMDLFLKTISTSLRKGDVYTRCSPTQFLVIVSDITFDNCKTVIERIERKYRNFQFSKIETIQSELQIIKAVTSRGTYEKSAIKVQP